MLIFVKDNNSWVPSLFTVSSRHPTDSDSTYQYPKLKMFEIVRTSTTRCQLRPSQQQYPFHFPPRELICLHVVAVHSYFISLQCYFQYLRGIYVFPIFLFNIDQRRFNSFLVAVRTSTSPSVSSLPRYVSCTIARSHYFLAPSVMKNSSPGFSGLMVLTI